MTRLTYTSGSLDTDTDAAYEAELAKARETGSPTLGHWIAGEEIAAGEVFERENPAFTDEVASRAHEADAGTIAKAVEAAKAAKTEWRRTPYAQRNEKLRAAAAWMSERVPEIAAILSLETGKSRIEAIAEVQEGIDLIETYCSEIEENDGYTHPLKTFSDNEQNTETLRPYGVFGVIGPFNFPFALCIGMSSAAMVAGNSVVLKPSEEAPWSAAKIAEAMNAGGVPAGVFNLVQGGPAAGEALVDAPVDGIAFTGSAEVGRAIAKRMHEGPYARPALTEMGGKNPAIVTANADLDKAAEGIARAAFGLSGQKCSACSRAIVVEDVYDELVEKLGEFTKGLTVGEPGDAGAFLGPVINEKSAERFEQAARDAEADGRIVAGGRRPDLPGYFVEPTVVADLPRGHRLTRDELFMPFVTVTKVKDFDEAIEEANDVVYGLTAGIFTEDDAEAEEFFDRIEAGVTYRNRQAGATTGAWPGTQSFCGWKSSGTTGKGGLGPHYVPQFMREQSRTVVS
jgi:1-pyrroline-5-carboxylate dehydrogenase